MTDKELENIEKLNKIAALITDPTTGFPIAFTQFFDFESDAMLDKKLEVLTEMHGGKSYADVPGFYDILELWPGNNEHWD